MQNIVFPVSGFLVSSVISEKYDLFFKLFMRISYKNVIKFFFIKIIIYVCIM
jgi:hypothetical protein